MDTQATIPTGGEGERKARDGYEPGEGCPDSETLAAFVEGTLEDAERAQVALHVTRCDDCLLVVGDTRAFLASDVELEETSGAGGGLRWRPKLLIPAGLLAAAALAIVAVNVSNLSSSRASVPAPPVQAGGPAARSEPRRELLDQAVAALFEAIPNRPASARLARLRYRPPPLATRSASRNEAPLTVLAAAARVEQAAEGRDDWESRWARGVAQLADGRVDEAVASLDGATIPARSAPATGPELDIDRAAAHLTRAERTGDAAAARRGLELSDAVLARDPASLPALFNRALALELLDRPNAAAAAWRAYLARDSSSPWAEEIRQVRLP